MNPVKALSDFGQSIWLDYIRRDALTTGELARLTLEDGIRGVTSNPSIFEKAIRDGEEYLQDIREAAASGKNVKGIYESLAIADIQHACDILRPVFDASHGADGFVSMEVSPYLAHQTHETMDEARRLFATIQRPNVMIKVPATNEGIPAIQQLISEGLNINVTLLFSTEMYEKVMEAYLTGLEIRLKKQDLRNGSASVASFFVSRVDSLADELLEEKIAQSIDENERIALRALLGKAAVANARMAYRAYERVFNSDRFKQLMQLGAAKQRILWASTSTKNPAYSDIKYIEELIAPDSVNTVPPESLDAFRDHGVVNNALAIPQNDEAILEQFAQVGIPMEKITAQLLDEGVNKFAKSFDGLLAAVKQKMNA